MLGSDLTHYCFAEVKTWMIRSQILFYTTRGDWNEMHTSVTQLHELNSLNTDFMGNSRLKYTEIFKSTLRKNNNFHL